LHETGLQNVDRTTWRGRKERETNGDGRGKSLSPVKGKEERREGKWKPKCWNPFLFPICFNTFSLRSSSVYAGDAYTYYNLEIFLYRMTF
jgi:hypothetical protein